MSRQPRLIIIIGASGSGKTTWRGNILRKIKIRFFDIDSDVMKMEGGDTSENRDKARADIDEEIWALVEKRKDFGFESVYAGETRPELVREIHENGYRIEAAFLGTEDPSVNAERVEERFREKGGHNVPEDKIVHDWKVSQKNLKKYWNILDRIEIFDTSDKEYPRLIATKEGGRFAVHVPEDKIPKWAVPIVEHGRRTAAA